MTGHRDTNANIIKRHMEIIVNVRCDFEVLIGQHRFVIEYILGC